jgi:hypothetical protein
MSHEPFFSDQSVLVLSATGFLLLQDLFHHLKIQAGYKYSTVALQI